MWYVTCNDPGLRNHMASEPSSSRDRVRRHREKLRARGLRPVQFWVPDRRSEAFRAEARRQSLAVAQSPTAEEDMDFVESISDYL